ncbi:hypothetical protein CEXT_729351, partial [Caerostris extrusa]
DSALLDSETIDGVSRTHESKDPLRFLECTVNAIPFRLKASESNY